MGYKLLLADDSITIQKVVGIIFANEDYELTVVDNGNAALEKAREIQPDVILVDALMPGKSGYDVCREIRQDPAVGETPLLLLVGAFEPFDEEKARNSGCDDHISKPFESQHLIEKVRALIDLGEERSRAGRQNGVTPQSASPFEGAALVEEAAPEIESTFAPVQGTYDAVGGEDKSSDVLYLDALEVVEAGPEDDLWGVFEVEEIVDEEEFRMGEVVEEEFVQPEIVDNVEVIEPFVFREEEPAAAAAENTISLGIYPEGESDVESVADEGFMFREEAECDGFEDFSPPGVPVESSLYEEPVAIEDSTEGDAEPSIYAGVVPPSPYSVDIIPAGEPEQPQEGVAEGTVGEEAPLPSYDTGFARQDDEAAEPADSGAPAALSLSEEQLAGILSRVSREIIEKIAWEVVPDLAETIIREEIRKIKEGC